MRLERRIEASRRHHERFPTAQKTRPHLPFVLFSRSTRALFSSTTPVPDRTNAPAQDGTGPNRSIWLGFPCLDASYLSLPPPSRRSDFRETVIFFWKPLGRSVCVWNTIFSPPPGFFFQACPNFYDLTN